MRSAWSARCISGVRPNARRRQGAAGSGRERTCLGSHDEREEKQPTLLLFLCGRTRSRGAAASDRLRPVRRLRDRRLGGRLPHRQSLLAPASA